MYLRNFEQIDIIGIKAHQRLEQRPHQTILQRITYQQGGNTGCEQRTKHKQQGYLGGAHGILEHRNGDALHIADVASQDIEQLDIKHQHAVRRNTAGRLAAIGQLAWHV